MRSKEYQTWDENLRCYPVKLGNARREMVRFGVFEADLRTGELRRKGRHVRMQEQPFQVLALLLARPGELVTREELRQALWPADTFVDFEHGLNKAISKLRDALGDDSGTPCYIETLPRRGYRFIAPVTIATPPLELSESQAAPATQPDPPVTISPPRIQWKKYATVLSLGLLALLASWFVFKLTGTQSRPGAAGLSTQIRSLAVLPLENLSGDKNQEYFADGVTDELITDLGQMSALRVISRTSVMHYRQTTETVRRIGRELGADAVVEGTVFRSGNRVRITAQLIDARNDRHLWAHAYERDLRDVITLQDEVARDIADEVRVKLTPQERARLTTSHPVNPQAHEAYLKGLYYWNQFTEAGVKKSLGFFQQAIKADPNYALGYAGMANYYGVMYVRFDAYPRDDACPKEEAAALKAVELDDSVAEAHLPLGAVRLFCDWDFQGAENQLERALQLNPNYAEAHRVYADLLAFQGHGDKAVAEAERAVESDPMSPDINMMLGWIYYLSRHYNQAIDQCRKTIGMDPNRPEAHAGLGEVYDAKGQFNMAIREYRKAVELSSESHGASPGLGYAYALDGRRREALRILRKLREMPPSQPYREYGEALINVGLDNRQQALAQLEKAYQMRDLGILGIKVDPRFDSLRSDPHFRDLVRRIGL